MTNSPNAYSGGDEQLLLALRWLRENSEVRDAAVQQVTSDRQALPDALLEEPGRLVTVAESVLASAREAQASSDVIAGLDASLTRFRAGAETLAGQEYTRKTLASLVGLRDRYELEPALETAIAGAPAGAETAKLSQMLQAIRKPAIPDLSGPQLGFSCDWGCCLFTCILCETACIVCCGLACIFC